jgi:lysophospholipase L1-like esterase
LLCSPANQEYYEDLFPKILVVRALAREFADAYIPLDGIFAAATVDHEASFWSADGIHPTEEGAKLIASQYLNAIAKLIEV